MMIFLFIKKIIISFALITWNSFIKRYFLAASWLSSDTVHMGKAK